MNRFKSRLIQLFNRFIEHPEVEARLIRLNQRTSTQVADIANQPSPYPETPQPDISVSQRDDIVFITGRFRSGSTLLWNAFRQLDNCTAYYEPFNERRWFDQSERGNTVDKTHVGVSDYWREYEGLEALKQWYDEDWIRHDLLMDERSWRPQMKRFIEHLIQQASGTPVLQFNRVDFRLPWLRHHFPKASLIHLYRNPRDQFVSFLTDKTLMNKDSLVETYKDAFYLDAWSEDLKKQFPFLDPKQTPHPYQRFYLIWKLSYLYGLKYADKSISYETLCDSTESTLASLFKQTKLANTVPKACLDLFVPQPKHKWQQYADKGWFEHHEMICETLLEQFLGAAL